ncbi:winged helix-turn-helix transcriptional regulator [Halorussus salinisoli]|uniref:winged helix-turn-helix transcriptional regulator n=1 Tax=Halorussus salinisoli TaxID=2558242 RepID=UPI0010C17615|nr:metalloregulator ArsR/SmtB family transcription factor [Halorussus salinisoli]
MEEPDLESRREIYGLVEENPGTHFRHLLEQLDYAQGTLQYNLRQLIDDGLVESSDDGKYTRYYPAGEFSESDQIVMNALRRKYSRHIIAHLLADGPLTTSDLSDRLEKSNSTISWHLSKLTDADLVTKERDGVAVYYTLTDSERARYLYTIHRQSFTDRLVDRLLGLWESY